MSTAVAPSRTLWFEHALNTGVFLGGIAWVLHSLAFVKCLRTLRWARRDYGRPVLLSLFLISALYGLSTASMICSFVFNQRVLIDEWPFASGPLASYSENYWSTANVAAFATGLSSMVLAYTYLIRCFYTIFGPRRRILAPVLTGIAVLELCAGIFIDVYCFTHLQGDIANYIAPKPDEPTRLRWGEGLMSWVLTSLCMSFLISIPTRPMRSSVLIALDGITADPALETLARSIVTGQLALCFFMSQLVVGARLINGYDGSATSVGVVMTSIFVQLLPASTALIVTKIADTDDSVFVSPSTLDGPLL